ncbi:high-affinity glucose transporter SNF3 [Lasiosphaeria ovina]|uniref:High-affinity glucose transporter SNF3 n=1 Tax=Lasiosphaeria ovina TaxID=92902 RepID=A0AAE0KGK0_9PEZI|nr:high-affinity glucose transporter SNF3 [Lasiosphaeria ovina]
MVARVEAPMTPRAYMMCVFAAFGGIFFGYDSGYISGVMGMKVFIHAIEGPNATALSSSNKSLITSILSAGIFFGALFAGDLTDWIGLDGASPSFSAALSSSLVAGLGVGLVSAVIIHYMSEIAPRKVRGALVSGYQFCTEDMKRFNDGDKEDDKYYGSD